MERKRFEALAALYVISMLPLYSQNIVSIAIILNEKDACEHFSSFIIIDIAEFQNLVRVPSIFTRGYFHTTPYFILLQFSLITVTNGTETIQQL